MSNIKRILIAIDDETNENIVIKKGLLLAEQQQADVMICTVLNHTKKAAHAFSDIISETQFREYLIQYHRSRTEDMVNALNTNKINITFEFTTGTPYIEIINQAFVFNADIIIQSSHSEQQGRLFFSSADWRLIRKSPVPVWIVKNTQPEIPQRMAVAIDVTDDSGNMEFNKEILTLAATIAKYSESQLDVFSAWEVFGETSARYSPFLNISEQQIDQILEKTRSDVESKQNELKAWLIDTAIINQDAVRWHIEKGDASEIIPQIIDQHDIGLLVIGTVNRTGVPGLLIGNTAETVLSKVTCSVLSIKPSLFESPVKP